MNIDQKTLAPGVVSIELSGRMDMQGVEWIKKPFEEAVKTSEGSILIDMSGVDYMSSIGIRALLMNAKFVTKRGDSYAILDPQPDVLNVLEVSGIDQIIPVYSGIDTALASLGK